MKNKILIAIIYLSGCVVNYCMMKSTTKETFGHWTKRDRIEAIGSSVVCSWLGVIAQYLVNEMENMCDEPANW